MGKRPLGLSIALHLAIIALVWNGIVSHGRSDKSFTVTRRPLEVRSLTEKELTAELDARKHLQNSEQIVQSDDQLVNEKVPDTKTERIFLSKNNQRVDKNTRAPRNDKFKNILEEGLENTTDHKKQEAGIAAVKEQKSLSKKELSKFDAKNLFALATDYQESDEGKADRKNIRQPSSVLGAAGKSGKGYSATDDYLDGVAVGANTLLNTQEFKFYGFYDRIRAQLVDRWRARIRKEIQKARGIASTGGTSFTQGSKITKLQVKLGPNGEINSVEKVGISGVEAFDKVAEVSFREAAPFPHPPKEMLKNNELTIEWDFVVLVEDASLVQFDVNRSL